MKTTEESRLRGYGAALEIFQMALPRSSHSGFRFPVETQRRSKVKGKLAIMIMTSNRQVQNLQPDLLSPLIF